MGKNNNFFIKNFIKIQSKIDFIRGIKSYLTFKNPLGD